MSLYNAIYSYFQNENILTTFLLVLDFTDKAALFCLSSTEVGDELHGRKSKLNYYSSRLFLSLFFLFQSLSLSLLFLLYFRPLSFLICCCNMLVALSILYSFIKIWAHTSSQTKRPWFLIPDPHLHSWVTSCEFHVWRRGDEAEFLSIFFVCVLLFIIILLFHTYLSPPWVPCDNPKQAVSHSLSSVWKFFLCDPTLHSYWVRISLKPNGVLSVWGSNSLALMHIWGSVWNSTTE